MSNKLPLWKQKDKQGHFITGGLLCLIVISLSFLLLGKLPLCCLVGFVMTVLTGIAKEIADSFDRAHHTPDVWDAICTGSGGLLASLLALGVGTLISFL